MKKIITIIIISLSIQAYATTYYIAPNGSDITARTGKKGSEWKTLYYACTRATKAGDTIFVMPGTYIETAQCLLKNGVSIIGIGTNSIIVSKVSNAALIKVEFTPTGSIKQTVSNLYFDGNNYTGHSVLMVYKSGVEIKNNTMVNFAVQGIEFQTDYKGTFATGNSVHDNIITNCANQDGTQGGNRSAIAFCDQDDLLIYNNTIVNNRANGLNGNCIATVPGNFKNVKIYNNTLHKIYSSKNPWDFAIELWNAKGGNEIYGNNIIGSIDIVDFKEKGNSNYTIWIHDNTIGQSSLTSFTPIYGFIIEQQIRDVLIENNIVQNVNIGIAYSLIGAVDVINLQFKNNTFKNIGVAGTPPWNMGFVTQAMHEGHNVSSKITNLYYDNNTFIGAINSTGRTAWGIELPTSCQASYIYVRNNTIKGFTEAGIKAVKPNSGAKIDYLFIQNNTISNCGNNNLPLFSGIVPTNYNFEPYKTPTVELIPISVPFQLSIGTKIIEGKINIKYNPNTKEVIYE